MTIVEEIYAALLLAKPGDLAEVRKYIKWIMIRRQVNDRFYFSAHWVTRPNHPGARPHWVGRYMDDIHTQYMVRNGE
jgi:hypothetical protein